MNLLLDSCVTLWWLAEPQRLPAPVVQQVEGAARVQVSVLTVWELLLKHAKGKLQIDAGGTSPHAHLVGSIRASGFELLGLGTAELQHLNLLPAVHRDPFDRMLICQAIEHGLVLVTPDANIRRYPLRTLWD